MMRRKSGRGSSSLAAVACSLLLLSTIIMQQTIAQTVHELVTTYQGGWVQDGVMFDVQTIETPSEISEATDGGNTTPNGITVHGLNILTPLTETLCVELYTKAGSFSSGASNKDAWTFLGSYSLVGQGSNTPTTIPLGAFDPINIGLGETQAFYVTTQNEKLRYTALDQEKNEGVTGDVYVSSNHYAEASGSSGTQPREISGATPPPPFVPGEMMSVGYGKERNSIPDEDEGKRTRSGYDPSGGEPDERKLQLQDTMIEKTARKQHEHDGRILQSGGLSVQILTGVAKNYPFAESWPHRVFNGALQYTLGINTSPTLTDAQMKEAFATKRGPVTCDVDAMLASELSDAPTVLKVPSLSPTKAPTPSPSTSPTKNPTNAPTTLRVKKVATTLHGGKKQSGMMFDIKVPSEAEGGPSDGLTVIGYETSTFLNEEVCIEVYTKSGTYQGFENDVTQNADGTWTSSSWSILGASTVIGAGELGPTIIPIGTIDPIYVPSGSTQAFYVTMTVPEQRYTEPKFGEKSGDMFSGSDDGDLELMVGSAVAYPFEDTWPNRIFNGAVVYALGNVPDGRYNDMTAADRERSCPAVTDSPTKAPSPSAGSANSQAIVDSTKAPTAVGDVVDAATTIKPTWQGTSVPDETIPGSEFTSRLADLCPASVVVTPDDLVTVNVIVPYKYTFIANSTADAQFIVTEMENTLHRDLMSGMCPVVDDSSSTTTTPASGNVTDTSRGVTRMLQDTIDYKGFRSNPTDIISSEGCGAEVTVPEGSSCYMVSGGVTAVVPSDTTTSNEEVTVDVETFAKKVLSNPTNYEGFGVTEVVYVTSDSSSEATDGTTGDGSTGQIPSVAAGTTDGNQEPIAGDPKKSGLSTTGTIIIACVCGVLAIAILAVAARHLRKKRGRTKRADSQELFQEFPDEEERYGIQNSTYGISASSSSGYHESIAPLSNWGRSSPPPPPPGRPSSAAVILNEADDISLFSSDKSKSRFGPIPDSPGGSKGSNSSKKSVEFVRAGQSFSTTRSNQPEDTVDL